MEMALLIMADCDPSKVSRRTMDQILEMTLPIDPERPHVPGYKLFEEWPADHPRVMVTHLFAEFLPPQIWHKKGGKVARKMHCSEALKKEKDPIEGVTGLFGKP